MFAQAVADALGIAPGALRIEARTVLPHQGNRLFDIWLDQRHLIGKVFCHPDSRRREAGAEREYQALQLLWRRGCAPRPVALLAGVDPAVVYEFAPGAMWDRQRPTPAQLQRLADVWLTLAAVPTAELWPAQGQGTPWMQVEATLIRRVETYVTWAHSGTSDRQKGEVADLSLETTRSMLARLRSLREVAYTPTLCHWDPRFANVIEAPGGTLRLVDWEDSGVSDPANDVACLLTHPNQEDLLSAADWRVFLEPYLAARLPADSTLHERIQQWSGGFAIFWLSLLLEEGVSRSNAGTLVGWRINEMDPNLRLRRYLARALAWPDEDFSRQLQQLQDCSFFDLS